MVETANSIVVEWHHFGNGCPLDVPLDLKMENPPEHRNPTTCDKWRFQVQLQKSTLRGAVALLFELIPMRVFPRLTFFKSHLDDLFLCLLRQDSDELNRFCDCFTATL